ncbi:MAG: MFS transporter [Rhodospirillales bacterium]
MWKAIKPVQALLLSVGLLLMGNGLQGTLLPIRAGIDNFTTFDIGILGSSYFFGFATGCLIGPYMVRRAGHIRAFTGLVAIASTSALIHVMLPVPPIWWVFRAMTGVCFAGLYMIIESWLNERSTNETRGTVFSIYTIINLTVLTAGQMMLTLSDPAGFILFGVASILVSLAAVPVAMTAAPAPKPVGQVKIRIRHLYHVSPVGFVGCLVVGLTNGSFWSLGPTFAVKSGMDASGVAIFMSITVIAGAFGQFPIGRTSDRMDRRRVIAAICLAASVSAVIMLILGNVWTSGLLIGSFMFGLFAFPVYSVCVAHTNDYVDPADYVETASELLLLFAAGAVVGPIYTSWLMTVIGPEALFIQTAIVHFLFALFVFYRMRVRTTPADEVRADFTEQLLNATTVAAVTITEKPDGEAYEPPAKTGNPDDKGQGKQDQPAEPAS